MICSEVMCSQILFRGASKRTMPILSFVGASQRTVLISLFLIVSAAPAASLPLLNKETRLSYSGNVAISGNTLAVDGAIYVRGESGWTNQQVIAGEGDLILDRNTLLFGTKIYVRNDSTWTLQHLLPVGTRLGNVSAPGSALSGDTITIGSPYGWDGITNTYAHGAVYLFARHGVTWTKQAVIEPPDPSLGMRFGSSVALSGDTLVIGAPGSWEQLPAVYVYLRQGTNWIQQAKLTDNIGLIGPKTMFGETVAVAGDGIAVGDPQINDYQGAVSLFRRVQTRTGSNWVLREKITGVSSNSWFGSVLSMSEAGMLAGGARPGTLRVFDRGDTTWVERSLTALTTGYVVGPEAAIGADALILNTRPMRAAIVFENEPRGWNNRNVGDTG